MPRARELAAMIAGEPAAAIEGLKRLTAHAAVGSLADGLAMEREILGELYRSEIGQRRVREFAERSTAKPAKTGTSRSPA
jgi:enoyl-CoA hydratase/carnithine racemase